MRLANLCGEDIIYCRQSDEYYVWDRTRWVRDLNTVAMLRLAKAVTRISAPSSSRMLLWIFDAMNSRTSGGGFMPSWAAFLRRMAIRVSRSGG